MVVPAVIAVWLAAACSPAATVGTAATPAVHGGLVSRLAINPAVNGIFADSFPGQPSLTDIDGFNDGQRLPGNGNNDYGPEAYFYTVPLERTAAQLGESDGALVGLIDVGPITGPMPADYTRLNITRANTVYCVFLRRTQVAADLKGWVTEATGTTCGSPTNANALQAVLYTLAGGNNIDYPFATRFIETQSGQVGLGMKCLVGWCEIGRGIVYKHANNPQNGVREQVKGWHDEQELAAPNGSGGSLIRSDSSSIIPVDGLQQITYPQFQSGLQRVATIYMKEDPKPGSKQAAWGLRQGVNYMWITLTSPTLGRAQFTQTLATPAPGTGFVVHRADHSGLAVTIPGVARWVWRETDEEAWIGCAQGCCTVSAM